MSYRDLDLIGHFYLIGLFFDYLKDVDIRSVNLNCASASVKDWIIAVAIIKAIGVTRNAFGIYVLQGIYENTSKQTTFIFKFFKK